MIGSSGFLYSRYRASLAPAPAANDDDGPLFICLTRAVGLEARGGGIRGLPRYVLYCSVNSSTGRVGWRLTEVV